MKMRVSVPFNGYVDYIIDVPDGTKNPREFANNEANKLYANDTLTFESKNGEIEYEMRGENGDDEVTIIKVDEESDDEEEDEESDEDEDF